MRREGLRRRANGRVARETIPRLVAAGHEVSAGARDPGRVAVLERPDTHRRTAPVIGGQDPVDEAIAAL